MEPGIICRLCPVLIIGLQLVSCGASRQPELAELKAVPWQDVAISETLLTPAPYTITAENQHSRRLDQEQWQTLKAHSFWTETTAQMSTFSESSKEKEEMKDLFKTLNQ